MSMQIHVLKQHLQGISCNPFCKFLPNNFITLRIKKIIKLFITTIY